MPDVIFFSWQSDLPNRTNRTIIGDALQRAALTLAGDPSIEVEPVVDRDTSGVPGSPDIAVTILRKIENARVFVADVSIVTPPEARRPAPNPNVLVELGFALHALGPERIIMVLNTAYGGVDLLPFDLRFKRALLYTLGGDEPPGPCRALLTRAFEEALRAVFVHVRESVFEEQATAFTTAIGSELGTLLVILDELPERQVNPWFERATFALESAASEVRRLAITAEADRIGATNELEGLADALIEIVRHHRHFGDSAELTAKADRAAAMAKEIRAQRVDVATITPESLAKAGAALRDLTRTIESIARRASRTIDAKIYQDFSGLVEEAAEVGFALLRVLQFKLDAIPPTVVQLLRPLARELHLLEVEESSEVNWSRRERTLERLITVCAEVGALLARTNFPTRA